MATYSQEFKEKMISKLLQSEDPNIVQLSKDSGVSRSALYQWLNSFKPGSNNNKKEKMQKENITPIRAQNWSAMDKLKAVIDTSSMAEEEIGNYCRQHGIYSTHLEQWQKAMIEGLKPSINKEHKLEVVKLKSEVKSLRSELSRKEKALAETAALLILKKKANLIWGEDKDV